MNKYEKYEAVCFIPILEIGIEGEIMLNRAIDDERWELCEKLLRFRVALEDVVRIFCKAGFRPSQPRVPAGNPDGGQWTDGVGGGRTFGDSVVDDSPRLRTVPVSGERPVRDMDIALNIFRHNRGLGTGGDCAKQVRAALNRAGFNVGQPKDSIDAKDYGDPLNEAGFKAFIRASSI